jgi:cytoskeleton protein RodZ
MSELKQQSNTENLTLGNMLKQAQIAADLAEVDVAQQLLLGKQIIVALENDDYSKIVAPVYARGYLTAYAQFLGLPVATVMAKFAQLNLYQDAKVFNDSEIKDEHTTAANTKAFSRRWLVYGISGIILLFIIIMVAVHQTATKSEATEAEEVATNETAAVMVLQAATGIKEQNAKASVATKNVTVNQTVPLPE